jgi:hypothetical protein
MISEAAAGHRFLCAEQALSMRDLAHAISPVFAPLGYKVPTGAFLPPLSVPPLQPPLLTFCRFCLRLRAYARSILPARCNCF